MSRSLLRPWLMAARPRTLAAGIVPVLVGLAFASRSVVLDWAVAVATLAAALLIQIATNLANDYYDFKSGADTAERLGPVRVTQAGLVEPHTVRNAALAVLALAAAIGAYLVSVGGWPILAIGVLSLLCALAYTAGPWPLAYKGLGDLFVFLFFGLVAVAGTVWLQVHSLDPLVWVVALPVACLATAILVVNNLRDIATDSVAGKLTLAVRLGPRWTRVEYVALTLCCYASVVVLAAELGTGPLLALLTFPLAWVELRAVFVREGAALNASLAGTARLHLLFGIALSLGLCV